MPYESQAQAAYFHANRKKLEAQGVNVEEWDRASKGKHLPKRKSAAQKMADAHRSKTPDR